MAESVVQPVSSGAAERGARALLGSLLPLDGPIEAAHVSMAALDWLDQQRLLPFVFYRLQRAGQLEQLPEDVRDRLCSAYYVAAADWTLLSSELSVLLAALRPLGVNPIVLKGMALGATLYPTPATRPTSDLDWLLRRDQLGLVRQVLESRGYRDMGLEQEHHEALTSHLHMWRESPHIMVEAHWHLVHDPSLASCMDLGDFFVRARPMDFGDCAALVLDPLDQLIHAIAHLAVNHTHDWMLLWLLDLWLLVERYGPAWDWAEVVARADGLGLAGSVKYWLELAEAWYGRFLPAHAAQAMSRVQSATGEAWYLESSRDGTARVWRVLWQRTFGAKEFRQRRAFLRDVFFPPWAYMQYRYGACSRWLSPVYYAWRLIRGGWVAFKRVGPASAPGRTPRPG